MRISDPIYGQFDIPGYIAELLATPEVRRLSNVRLLNALSPSLATLGEIRRYSHTLGVIFLASKNSFMGYDAEAVKAFFAAVLLHDIGTPPFGHLFEYQLRDRYKWHHENVISSVISGKNKPEAGGHQIFGGRAIQFLRVCRRLGINEDFLFSLVSRSHPLSKLIFGTLDFDNLDNVIRMSWALGIGNSPETAIKISAALAVNSRGELELSLDLKPSVAQWLSLRRRVYDVLVFDGPTVAAQAVLSKAIATGFDQGVLTAQDWDRHDEELVELLRRSPITKTEIIKNYLGRLPELAICIQVEGSLRDMGFDTLQAVKVLFDEVASPDFLTYVFLDQGAFEKHLQFVDPQTQTKWSIGATSESVILYAFAGDRLRKEQKQAERVREAVINRFSQSARSVRVHA
jgi:HD superfamily phosphohydrolase